MVDTVCMDISEYSCMSTYTKSELPAWRMPISTSFSSSLRERNSPRKTIPYSQKCQVDRHISTSSEEIAENEDQLIQILLRCIVCDRTFSPEALEQKRKKGTLLEDFIPPTTFDALTDNRFVVSRDSRNQFERNEPTTKSTLMTPPSIPSSTDYPYDDASEFGSNNSKENNSLDLPRYAKPIAPTDICPYCNSTFGIKSFDRQRRRYEIQPTPKEKKEAWDMQELRTKYRPMKSSSSCSSLRALSPAKDFASLAKKLFGGLRRTEGSSNLYFNQVKNDLKKSNESISASCYGDYPR
ncbi:unnamed protein product [Orchesella dallaii]|uniref:Uncharacterized protein n=1 Tax=Orchesella dallaii TaxID=48710 RepID=A0ABP1RQQ2_9HEXA